MPEHLLNCSYRGIIWTKGLRIISMKKIIKNAIVIFSFLILGISTALLVYVHFFAAGDNDLSGEWTAKLDMSKQAAVTALDWLQDIEAVSVSLEDMESCMQDLNIRVYMMMEQTERGRGTFRCQILPESYDACNQAAYEAFAASFRELLGERLRMAGYASDTDQEAVEALVLETFGMSSVSYLMTCGPVLLPPLEELQAQFDGSGVYENADGILIRQFAAADIKEENYIRKDASLILLGEADSVSSGLSFNHYPLIYTLTSSPANHHLESEKQEVQ